VNSDSDRADRHVEASIGGWPGPAFSIRVEGATVEYEHVARYDDGVTEQFTTVVSNEEQARFWAEVEAIQVWDWASEYVDHDVCDGTHWSVVLAHGGRHVDSHGSNAFPDAFKRLCAALSQLCGGRPFH
jgi:hypothetical protein